jgi:aminoglycoside 2''-phosphotransferase
MSWPKPETQQIKAALREYAPRLADEPIEFLAEGWEFWAFSAGYYVLRFPRPIVDLHRLPESTTNLMSLEAERRVLPELSKWLTAPVPEVLVFEHGPNGAPFALHRMLPGEPVLYASRAPGPGFGTNLGRLLRELRSFPVTRALELGVAVVNGPALHEHRGHQYEAVVRRIFPLVSCEARTYIERRFETYLNQAANFEFEPSLLHQDLEMNTLIDAESGELSGVIDFGGLVISSPAIDLWLPVFGFPRLGIAEQLTQCLLEAGIGAAELERMRPEVEFCDFNFPLVDVLSGLEREDATQVEDGIKVLNAALPRDARC